MGLLVGAGGLPAAAAQVRDGLSLFEALEIAADNNPQYRISLADLETASALDRPSWAAFLPSLSLAFGTNLSQSRAYTGQDEFGRPVRRDDPAVYTSSGSSQSLSVGQLTLFDGGQKLASARADRARAGALRAGVSAASTELRYRLQRRYYAAVAAEQEIALHEQALASAVQLLEGTRRLMRVGIRDPLDLLGAELQVAEREHVLERSRGAARAARLALGEEMGTGRVVTEELTDALPDVFDPGELDLDGLVARAHESSPGLVRLQSSVHAADEQFAAARGRRWPTISLSGSTSRAIGSSGSGALFELNPLDQRYGLNLSVNIPLFDQYQTGRSLTQARVDRLAAEERLRAGRLQLEARVRGAMIELENAHRDVRLAERTAELSLQRLQLAEERYRLGGSTFDDLRGASDVARERAHAVLTARQAFGNAVLDLEEAVGGPLR